MANKDLTFYNKTERPWLNRLDRSAIVGHTTATSTKLWFRLKSAGDYQVVISTQPIRGQVAEAPQQINSLWQVAKDESTKSIDLLAVTKVSVDGSTDFTVVIDTDNHPSIPALEPDTVYYYGVYSETEARWELGAENAYSFRTLPVDGKGPWDITFGIYSCHQPFDTTNGSKADASMWALMNEELRFADARFVIGAGDQVYSDGTDYLSIWAWLKKVKKYNPTVDDMRSWYRDIYRGYWGFPDLKAVHRQFPNYMIWDDHEIMDGWGSYTKSELSNQLDSVLEWENKKKNITLANRMFDAAKQTYVEYQHSHNPTTPNNQFDFTVANGGADYFYLDMRGQRDFSRKEFAILGAAQFKRFSTWAEQLSTDRDGPIFVVSPVPMVHLKDFVANTLDWLSIFGARDDVRDHWQHDKHNAEFKKMLNLLFTASNRTKRPLVIISGDVHVGGIFELFDLHGLYPDAKVFQITSSAITYAALGPMKLSLLSKGVSRRGEIGVYKAKNGKQVNCGFGYRNHLIFPQYNFALVRYRTDGVKTTHLQVDLIGKSTDSRVKESKRMDLLRL